MDFYSSLDTVKAASALLSLRPEYEARVTQDGFVHRLRREGDAGNGQTGCGNR